MADLKENVIEWCNGDDTISVTLNQQKYINKVRKLSEKHPDLVRILAENSDWQYICPLTAKKLEIEHNYTRQSA